MGRSPLEESGLPLFFRVANAEELAFAPAPSTAIAIRTAARSLSTMQKEALVATGAGGPVWRLASDEGPYLLGDDVAPPPLAFVSVGLVTDFAEAIRRAAGAPAAGVRLVQDTRYTMKGSTTQGTLRAGALPVELRVDADLPGHLVQQAVRAAPSYGLVRPALGSRFSLVHNGRSLPVERVLPADGPAPDDPRELFPHTRPARDPRVIQRDGQTPKTEEDTRYEGSSLAETQDRTLHLQTLCAGDANGLWRVEHRMYNPRGTIFHFVCDPTGERAPAPLAYLSAGIAFCFMTQLARYARILRKRLLDFAVVQDTAFCAGDYAAPVVTHVYLDTEEDDAFAQELVAAGERTCFVHALCRTELDVRFPSS
jgi:hypothetical protein